MVPLREFMMRQIGKSGTKDVALFLKLGKVKQVKSFEEVPSYVLIPAFMLSELSSVYIYSFLLLLLTLSLPRHCFPWA